MVRLLGRELHARILIRNYRKVYRVFVQRSLGGGVKVLRRNLREHFGVGIFHGIPRMCIAQNEFYILRT